MNTNPARCPDCHGTGRLVLLTTDVPCVTCLGTGLPNVTQVWAMTSAYELVAVPNGAGAMVPVSALALRTEQIIFSDGIEIERRPVSPTK